MDEKSISSDKDMEVDKTCEDNEHNQSKTSDTAVHIASCDDGKSKANNNGTIDRSFPLGEEEEIEENSEDSASSEAQDASLEMNGENGNRTAEEQRVQEEEHETSGEEQIQEEECETLGEEQILEKEHETSGEKQIEEEEHEPFGEEQIQEKEHESSGGKHIVEEDCETFEEAQIQEEERETSVEEEEKICGEESETSSASMEQDPSLTMTPRVARLSNRSKPVDKDSEAVPMQSEPLKKNDQKKASPSMTPTRRSARRSLPDSKMGKEVKKELSSPKRLIKPEKPSNRPASNAIQSPKRKRLMWTEEEEEALRKGVKKCSNEANVKILWTKILESSDKFDPTRNPGDLKDKWRNMTVSEIVVVLLVSVMNGDSEEYEELIREYELGMKDTRNDLIEEEEFGAVGFT